MGGLIFVICVFGVIYNLCKDAKIHNTPVIGSKKDIITTHPERYRNYLECERIIKGENRQDPDLCSWESVSKRAQEAIDRNR